MKQIVNLSDELVRNQAFWRKTPRSFYYSGHCHRGSAIETDDSCGNCDGARCESCKKVIIEPHYSFSCYGEVIYTDLLSQGYDADIASDLAYNDFGCKTHTLHMPTEDEMPEETRLLIETPCKEVWDWCNTHKDVFCDSFELKDQYRQMMQNKGISWDEGLDFYLNQIEFWSNVRHEFVEVRQMYRDDLRNLCIRQQWYTKGDCKAYDNLLDMCDGNHMDNTKLYIMARDIITHSNMENGETESSVMFELARICVTTFGKSE